MSIFHPLPFPLPNVRSQKIIPGRTNIQANSAVCDRTSRKCVLIDSGAAGQQRTFGIIYSEAGRHSGKCTCADGLKSRSVQELI